MVLTVDVEGVALGEVVTLGRAVGVVTAIAEAATVTVLRGEPDARDVRPTGRLAEVPVGAALVGRVLDPLGAPLDRGPALDGEPRRRHAGRPLGPREHATTAGRVFTGIKAVELCAPLLRGAVAVACGPALRDVLVTCAAAQAGGGTRPIFAVLGGEPPARLPHGVIVAAPLDATPAMVAMVPGAAIAIAEDVRERGGDALVLIDDLDRLDAALHALTPAERYSAQAAVLARARTTPPSARPSPLDVLFAVDQAWLFEAPRAGGLSPMVPPRGLTKYAPRGTPRALIPHASAIRLGLARGDALSARLLDQTAAPVTFSTIVALAVAAGQGLLRGLAADDVAAFERELVRYLDAERPALLAIDPARPLDEAATAALGDATREVLARLTAN